MKKTALMISVFERKVGWFIPQWKWLSFVILLLAFFPVNAQKQQVDLNLKNVSLVDVLMAIEHTTTYSFVFKMEDVERVNNLTVQMSDRSVKEILDYCLLNTGLSYELEFLGLNPLDGGPMFDNIQERKELFEGMSKYDIFTTVLTPSGQRDPKIQGGLSNTFRYKKLPFECVFGL